MRAIPKNTREMPVQVNVVWVKGGQKEGRKVDKMRRERSMETKKPDQRDIMRGPRSHPPASPFWSSKRLGKVVHILVHAKGHPVKGCPLCSMGSF